MSDNCMPEHLATLTVKKYCCSKCWGQLIMTFDRVAKLWNVRCPQCGDCNFVTKAYAERREVESIGEASEVRRLYPQIMPKRSANQIVKELGF